MSEELKKQADEDLVKSLAEELDMPEEEIKLLLKSDDTGDKDKKKEGEDEEEEEKGKKKPVKEDEEEEEKGKKKPEMKKSESGDLSGMSKDDIKKSISSLMGELKTRDNSPVIEKSETNNLLKSLEDNLTKSFTDSLGEMKEGFEKSVKDLTDEVSSLKETIEVIGENSQGTKGVDFGFISKAGDDAPIVEEGKTIISSKDREFISNKLFEIIEKSTDDNLKKSASVDLINYQGSGEISKNMLSTLNSNDVFFKEQMKKKNKN